MYGGRGIFGQITHSNVIVRIPFHTTWVELASSMHNREDECRRKAAVCGPHFRHQHGRN